MYRANCLETFLSFVVVAGITTAEPDARMDGKGALKISKIYLREIEFVLRKLFASKAQSHSAIYAEIICEINFRN